MRCGPACIALQRHSTARLRINDVMAENFRRQPQYFLNLFRLLFALSLLFSPLPSPTFFIFPFRLLCEHLKSLIRNLAVLYLVRFVLISLDFITPRSFVEKLGSRDLQSDRDSCYGIFIQCRSGIALVITSKGGGVERRGWGQGRGSLIRQKETCYVIFPNALTSLGLNFFISKQKALTLAPLPQLV